MIDKLYIVGNGFDLHHGLNTSYTNFRDDFVRKSHPNLWRRLYDIYGDKLLNNIWWNNFEEELAHVDYVALANSNNGIPLGFSKVRNILKYQLPPLFASWIKGINTKISPKADINIEKDAFFFTFNYTMTLEEAYLVPYDNIWHIHNSIANHVIEPANPLVVGHDSSIGQLTLSFSRYRKSHPSISPSYADAINKEVANSAKKVRDRIKEHEDIFYNYVDITHFVAMGFSFNDIDIPYIEKIINVNKDIEKSKWLIYWHADGEGEKFKDQLYNIGISKDNIVLERW